MYILIKNSFEKHFLFPGLSSQSPFVKLTCGGHLKVRKVHLKVTTDLDVIGA